jgi:hypothetical protein
MTEAARVEVDAQDRIGPRAGTILRKMRVVKFGHVSRGGIGARLVRQER